MSCRRVGYRRKSSYLWLIATAIIVVWTANVFEIVALASRAFAVYYLLQCLVAIGVSTMTKTGVCSRRPPKARYAELLAIVMMAALLGAVALFAMPVG